MHLIRIAVPFSLLLVLISCKKEPEEIVVNSTLENGMVILCEGLFQQNNSSVSWVNFSNSTITNTLFQDRAFRLLGDTGNDMQRYGNKIYIVVNASSTVEIIDALSFKPLQQILMQNGGIAKQPRSVAFYGSNAYVSCYDGFVDVIDTTSMLVTQRIQVGANPEGMAVANNKLYVANSGGLNFPNVDSTLSVIDLSTNTELQKIVIGKNPGSVIADSQGEIYVINRGNYGAIPSSISRVSSQTDAVLSELSINATVITHMNSDFLIADLDITTNNSSVIVFDPLTETISNSNFINTSGVTTLYGIQYNSSKNLIFISDAMGYSNTGYIRSYLANGNALKSYHVGLNPSKILFYD